MLGIFACSSDCEEVVVGEGARALCENQCTDAACAAGQRCVQHDCANACASHDDCPSGKHCAHWGFADGSQGDFCVTLDTVGHGQFGPCQADAECDALRSFRCISNQCLIAGCHSHTDCWPLGLCTPQVIDGQPINICQPSDPAPVVGRVGAPCPNGDSQCDRDNDFHCLGSPPGDLDAYCTKYDCTDDADCGVGYACVRVSAEDAPFDRRGPTSPCEDACGFSGNATDGCAPVAEIGPGNKYECGATTLLRNMCRKREYCHPCESDLDCMSRPDQICARDKSGAKICTSVCDPDVRSCPWGNASECGVWDEERGVPTCAHRFGSCVGSGGGCEPCLGHSDCGPQGLCYTAAFTGERFCIDFSAECACEQPNPDGECLGGGCPNSPSGAQMICLGGPQYEGSTLHQACFGAHINTDAFETAPLTGCWRP